MSLCHVPESPMSDSQQRISSYLQNRDGGCFQNIDLIHSMASADGGNSDLLESDLRQLLSEVQCQRATSNGLVQLQEPSVYPEFGVSDFAAESPLWKRLGVEPNIDAESAIKSYVRSYIDADRAIRHSAAVTDDEEAGQGAQHDTYAELARDIQSFARPSFSSLDLQTDMVLPVGALWRYSVFKHLNNGGWKWGDVGMLTNANTLLEQQQGRMEIRPVYLQQVVNAGAEYQAGVTVAAHIVGAMVEALAIPESATSKLSGQQLLAQLQERIAALGTEQVKGSAVGPWDAVAKLDPSCGCGADAVAPQPVWGTAPVERSATMGGSAHTSAKHSVPVQSATVAGAGQRETAVMTSDEHAKHFDICGDMPTSREALSAILQPLEQSSALSISRIYLKNSSYKRIFINGPLLNGLSCNRSQFHKSAEVLRHSKWHVCMPHAHGSIRGTGWADFMQNDLGRLATCDSIFALPHWSKSKGASLLMHFAHMQGIEIIYAEGAETYMALPGMQLSMLSFAEQVSQRQQQAHTETETATSPV